ncbi:MAG: hypothetical protein MUE74_04605 [Bacteroidales bacterium]|nr:hypothetical protein [Bacteroidales bacterium]
MKKGNTIQLILALILGFSFLMGSTGLTVILHSCHHCGDLSVETGIFLPPEEPEDHCCGFADSHGNESGVHAFVGEYCHFKVDRMKLTNYAPSGKITIELPFIIPFTYSLPRSEAVSEAYTNSGLIHNKHGGRSMITSMCQFLS